MRAITAVKEELSSKTKTKFSQWLQKNYITQVRVQDFVRGGGGGGGNNFGGRKLPM